ncbi:MAG: hypothetical protein C0391_01795 [Anaerolinea sp.]|nr:hypothetical protein [Anaerolinea sp.]
MTDVFISYSRKDIAFARLVHEALRENGFDTWIDWQDIPPSTDWMREVYTAIEQTDTFIFILSSASTISDICKLEIEHARKNNKRLIPIVINEVDPSSVHPVLAAINWIFSRTQDEFQAAIRDLVVAIQTDYGWVKEHTRLQIRALEWERSNSDKSFLLRGTDLDHAEGWIAEAVEKTPEPTLLQTRYVQTSRQEAAKRQRYLLFAVGCALAITIILGVVAVINGQHATRSAVSLSTQVVVAQNAEATAEQEADFRATQQAIAEEQKRIAEEQTTIAHSRELAALATKIMGTHLDLGSLLAIESVGTQKNFLSTGSLLQSLQTQATISRIYHTRPLDPGKDSLGIKTVKFHPKGLYIITGDINGIIRFWDPLTGSQAFPSIQTFEGAEIRQIAISPDGEHIASINRRAVQLWDIKSGKQVFMLLQTHSFYDIAFSPDGKNIAAIRDYSGTGQNDQGLKIWDSSTGQLLREEQFNTSWNTTLGYSPDGSIIFVFDGIYYDIKSLKAQDGKELVDDINLCENCLAQRASDISINKKIAIVDYQNRIYLYDYITNRTISIIKSTQSGEIIDLEFSKNGNSFYTVSDSGIYFWDAKSGALGGILLSMPNDFTDIEISPDNKYMVCVDNQGEMYVLAPYLTSSTGGPFNDFESTGEGLEFSKYNPELAVAVNLGSKKYAVTTWDSNSLTLKHTIPLDISSSFVADLSLGFLPDNKLVVSGEGHHTIRYFDTTTGLESGNAKERDRGYVEGAVLSPDGNLIASSDFDGNIILTDSGTRLQVGPLLVGHDVSSYDVPDPSGVHQRGVVNYVRALDFSPDGKMLASGGNDTTIRLWDVKTGKQIGDPILGHVDVIRCIAFSPDGNLLASAGEDGAIHLWDVAKRESIGYPLKGHEQPVYQVLFSTNGNTLISASQDGTIRFWDVASHQPIGLPINTANPRQLYVSTPQINPLTGYTGNTGPVYDIALSPDGTKLLSADGDGGLRIWELDVDIWLERACLRAGRNLTQDEWNLYLPYAPYHKTCPQFP